MDAPVVDAVPYREPGGRTPAPAPLRLIQLFVNSYDDLTKKEIIGTPTELERWLSRRGFHPGGRTVRRSEIVRLHRLREALREVLAAHNGGPPPGSGTIATLNLEARRVCISASFSEAGDPALDLDLNGISGLLSSLFGSAIAGAERGMWERLKACRECGWVFYDHSRNGRGSWCTMAVCGSRAKMRAYRRRRARGDAG
jgi:predicted RNA-binding Zn ribbon-like protein